MPQRSGSQANSRTFDARSLEQLACPICFGDLRLAAQTSEIVCAGCGRKYPVIDGIPVLIAERATISE